MASQQMDAEALRATTPTPIADLSPDLSDLSSRAIDGSVTITWPFSASKRLLAFVLADHDFRKRRNKGQIRLEFHDAAGKVLDKAKIASGDSVRLSLDGAEWLQQGHQPGLAGEPLGWQLKFSRKLLLSLTRLEANESESITVDGETDEEPEPLFNDDAPMTSTTDYASEPQEELSAPRTPLMNVSTKRLASTAFDNLEEYVSPAFLKRAKVSYGSLFEGGFEALEEETSRHSKKGRRKSRFSMPAAAWRYSSRTPSPSPEREEESEVEVLASEDEVVVPGLSFGANKSPSKAPEPHVAMVDESSQTQQLDDAPSDASQRGTIPQSMDKDISHEVLMKQAVSQQTQGADGLPVLPTELVSNSWTSAPLGKLPIPASEALPLPSPVGQSFDFGLDSGPLAQFDTFHTQQHVPAISSTNQDLPLTHASASGSTFPVDLQPHLEPAIHTTFGHHTPERDTHMHEDGQQLLDVDVSPSESSRASVASQHVEGQPQTVETIEILSSSPVHSPRAPPLENIANPAANWTQPEDAEVEAASDEDVVYDEQSEDEDAEGSAVEETEWTHDATPDDDADVPGEDYDLRKYDDAHEDDEEGNIDRDSLLSTDGEGNVVPPNPGTVSPSSSDYEEEGAALDVDDDVAEANEADVVEENIEPGEIDLVQTEDPANVSESDAEASISEPEVSDAEAEDEELAEQSDLSGYDDDEMGYEYEEEEYESEADDQIHEQAKPSEPVFIDLLSDSEDEAENEAEVAGEPREEHLAAEPLAVSDLQRAPDRQPVTIDKHEQDEQDDEDDRDELADDQEQEELLRGEEPAQDVAMEDAISTTEAQPQDTQVPVIEDAPLEAGESQTLLTSAAAEEPKVAEPLDEEPVKDQASILHNFEQTRHRVQTRSGPEHSPDAMVLDDVFHTAASLPIEESTPTQGIGSQDQLPPQVTISAVSSPESLSHDGLSTSQPGPEESTYQTQPPMSLDDLTMTQSSLLTQTEAGSQTQPAVNHIPPVPDPPDAPSPPKQKKDETHSEKGVQQLITPETQQAEPAGSVGVEASQYHERSPGPDDQLHLEMRQREAEAHSEGSPTAVEKVHAVTEEEELAAIEDEAEHDPTLAEKDYIITADSLRSHDHKEDDATAEGTSKDDSQSTISAVELQQAESRAATPNLSVPPRRSHRKTRSSGSIELSTNDADVNDSQASATQQLSQEDNASQELETSKTPVKPRVSRRRRAVPDVDIDAANASHDSTQDGPTRSLRSSPRSHKRTTSDAIASQEDVPMSPSVAESSQKVDKPASSKAQLLRMLQSDLPEFLSLKVLRNSLHKTVDILAVAAATPSAPVRPKNGPRDYMLELVLTDPSTAPSTVSVAQIYRPHQKSLPIVKAGDVVLLRRFQVLSMKGRGFGIRAGDDSAWAVFERDDEEKLPQIMGPPVEVTEEEVMYVMGLAGWWDGMGEDAWKKAEKAGEKAKTVSGDGK